MSAVIADAIEAEIVAGGWDVGSVIATESELIDRFSVSRATMREALNQIQHRGLATMRAGKGGGLVVVLTAFEATVEALSSYLRLASASVSDILEARMLLEQQAVSLATERIDDDDIRILRALVKDLDLRTGELGQDARAHLEVRRQIARAAKNQVLSLLIDALSISALDVISTQIASTSIVQDTIRQTGAIKAALVEAIVACDKGEALRLSRDDVRLQIEGYRALAVSRLGGRRAETGERLKRPEQVAMAIGQRIVSEQLPVGFRLGSEPELQETYGISRAVLREAVRTMEAHSIVQMRRGAAGGLIVAHPDATNTIAAVVRFLRSMGVTWQHLFEVREAIELGAVERGASRASIEQLSALRAAHHLEFTLPDGVNPVPIMTAIHKQILETCANPVLNVITKLVIDTSALSYRAPPSRANARQVAESHHAVIRALCERDPVMARRRAFAHLLLLGEIGHDLTRVFGDADGFRAPG